MSTCSFKPYIVMHVQCTRSILTIHSTKKHNIMLSCYVLQTVLPDVTRAKDKNNKFVKNVHHIISAT